MFHPYYSEEITNIIDNILNSGEYNKDRQFKTKGNTKYTVKKDKENNTVIYIPASGLNRDDIVISENTKVLNVKSNKKPEDSTPYTDVIDITFKLDKFDNKNIKVDLVNGILTLKLKPHKEDDKTFRVIY